MPKKFDEITSEATRVMAIKMYCANKGSENYGTIRAICDRLGVSRTMLYYWLQQAGISTVRKERKEIHIRKPTPTSLMAALRGVSFPTARKYVATQSKIIRQGFATLNDLHNYGITYMRLNTIRAELGLIGIELSIERRELCSKRGLLTLDVVEFLELLANPRKFLFENSTSITARWE
jgi:hypothetical protein